MENRVKMFSHQPRGPLPQQLQTPLSIHISHSSDCPVSYQSRVSIICDVGSVQESSTSTSCGSVGGLTGIACGPLLVPVASPNWPNSGSISIVINQNFVGGLPSSRCKDSKNEEEWEGSTLVDFAEIGAFQSRKRASPPARVKKCMPGATWIPPEFAFACCVPRRNAVCLHRTAAALHHSVRTNFLNFKMQARADLSGRRGGMSWLRARLMSLMLCILDLWQGDGCHEDKRAGCARRLLCRVRP